MTKPRSAPTVFSQVTATNHLGFPPPVIEVCTWNKSTISSVNVSVASMMFWEKSKKSDCTATQQPSMSRILCNLQFTIGQGTTSLAFIMILCIYKTLCHHRQYRHQNTPT